MHSFFFLFTFSNQYDLLYRSKYWPHGTKTFFIVYFWKLLIFIRKHFFSTTESNRNIFFLWNFFSFKLFKFRSNWLHSLVEDMNRSLILSSTYRLNSRTVWILWTSLSASLGEISKYYVALETHIGMKIWNSQLPLGSMDSDLDCDEWDRKINSNIRQGLHIFRSSMTISFLSYWPMAINNFNRNILDRHQKSGELRNCLRKLTNSTCNKMLTQRQAR